MDLIMLIKRSRKLYFCAPNQAMPLPPSSCGKVHDTLCF
nr:MAG TPA: hypothetical protein [Caudoviricetes sp.]